MTDQQRHGQAPMTGAIWPAIIGAAAAFIGVAGGALGTHALRDVVDPVRLSAWQTAVLYQLVHGVMLVTVGMWSPRPARTNMAALAWTVGIVLFSGSLYLRVLTDERAFGMLTPVGGIAFLVGHAILVVVAFGLRGRRA